jgi:hypothetical protein
MAPSAAHPPGCESVRFTVVSGASSVLSMTGTSINRGALSPSAKNTVACTGV